VSTAAAEDARVRSARTDEGTIMAPRAQPFATRADTMAAFADHVSRGKVEAFEALGIDIVLGRREGPFFWDAFDGRRFFNCHCNGGVFNLGHRNPRVLAAVRDALDTIDVGNHHLVSGWKAELGRRLAATTANRLPGVVLSPSGSEAVEVAVKAAYATTGRHTVVSVHGAYHGHTALAAMAADAKYHEPFGLELPGFVHVAYNDLDAMDRVIGNDTAAVVLEAIPATLGMPLPADGYLRGIQERCRDRGAVFVLDEVQTGLGRTGRMWCHEHDDVEPDVIVTGKGLGGGVYPVAATLMTPAVHRIFDEEPFVHVSSYGGSDLGCVVALTVLDVVEEPGFLDRVEDVGLRLEKELAPLPCDVRRRGLFLGLRWPDEGAGVLAAKACIDAGVFAVFANNDTSVLQFLPPLVLEDDEVDELVAAMVGALS
jgi:acetylornithine/succinyldiaminopimelate/putrescine aminotransferase